MPPCSFESIRFFVQWPNSRQSSKTFRLSIIVEWKKNHNFDKLLEDCLDLEHCIQAQN